MKAVLMAALVAVASPGAAQDLSPGHIMEARLLGLDPQLFTRTDLAQIAFEERLKDPQQLVRFILEMKERRGELPRGFARSPEGRRIARSVRFP